MHSYFQQVLLCFDAIKGFEINVRTYLFVDPWLKLGLTLDFVTHNERQNLISIKIRCWSHVDLGFVHKYAGIFRNICFTARFGLFFTCKDLTIFKI